MPERVLIIDGSDNHDGEEGVMVVHLSFVSI